MESEPEISQVVSFIGESQNGSFRFSFPTYRTDRKSFLY